MGLRTYLQSSALLIGTAALSTVVDPAPVTLHAQEVTATPWRGLIDHASALPGGVVPSGMVESAARGISADGRYVVLQSAAPDLVADDTNWTDDVFLRDRMTGGITRVSVADDGTQANRQSVLASISADGRHVAFMSNATNLVPGAEDHWWFHVYVRDLERGRTARVSVATGGSPAGGDSRSPVLSGDGRFVAFVSEANLAGVGDFHPPQAFVHDRDADADGIYDEPGATSTTLVSVSASGAPANDYVDHVRISADGRFVLLESGATNLDPAAWNRGRHAFVHDRQAGTTVLVDRNTAGAASTYGVDYRTSDLSDDGRYVSFASYSPDIASLPMNFVSQVYRFDRVTGETALVSIAPDGMPADNSSYSTSISGDGRFVAVMTIASNLAQPAPPGTGAVVVRDMAAAGNVRVDLLADDLPLNHFYPYYVTISADGTAVAFSSDATNAGRGETGNGVNAFVATGLDAAPRAASFTTAGGSASLAVTVSRVAGWDAQSLADWIEITDGNGFGAGPRTVRFSVGPNRTGGARQAGIRLGSTVVAVHQAWDPDAAPVTPTIAWAPPAPIVYGTALGGSQLNAAADTAGTFSYSPAAGTLLGAGTHTLTATFTPRDPARFTTASATTTLVVERATPVMTWNPAGALVYGMPLGAAQLNATASTSGEIAYRPAAGSLLHAGAHAVVATLTPADAANYTSVTLTRRVTVLRAPVVIRPEDASKPYGAPLPAFSAVAEGLVNGDGFAVFAGTPAFSTAATAMSAVGAYPVHVSGLEAADYAVTYAPGTLTIVPAATVLSLSSEPTPVGWNEPVTLTATVAGVATDIGVPTGSVQFFDGEVLLGSAPLESGTAVLATSVMSQGSHTITAAYSGDACFAGSSGSASQVVDLLDSASFIVLSSSASPSHYGRPVTFAAALSSSSRDVSGYVDFYDAMTPIGSAPIVRGIARLATAGLAEGGHAITARFRGNAALPPSVSPVIAQHVRDGDPVNRTPVVSVAAAGAAGSPIRLTATAAATHPEAPVGRVLFLINGVVVGEVAGTLHGTTLSAQAVAGAALAPGTYRVTAVYLGSRRYRATAASTTLTIE